MPVARKEGESKALHGVEVVQYSIDFVTAILLLTGRITTSGIFVVPEGFFLAATGPILGGDNLEGKTVQTALGLRAVNLVSAILLILNVIRVTGPYIYSQRALIIFSGEIFGIKPTTGAVPLDNMNRKMASRLRRAVREELLNFNDAN